MPSPAEPLTTTVRLKRLASRRNIIGFAIGVVLLAVAVWVAGSHEQALSDAWTKARSAPWWLVGLALLLPALNWIATSIVFIILNRRYAKVTGSEMHALIGAAWMLNYLPMRPGMFGRMAWHRKYHGITIPQSAKVIGWSMLASAIAFAGLLVPALVFEQTRSDAWTAAAAAAVGFGGLAGLALVTRDGNDLTQRLWAASVVRYVDAIVWAARYATVFALVGRPISPGEAVALAIVSQAAMTIPLAGNGLGLREWAIGALAAVLPSEAFGGRGMDGAAVGVATDLVHRGLEVVTALAVSSVCMVWLERIRRRRARNTPDITGT